MSVLIDLPPEEVFEYLADIANHAEFNDHFIADWRLTREDTYGLGAGVRYRVETPLNRFPWGDSTFVEFEPPAPDRRGRAAPASSTASGPSASTRSSRAAGGGTRVTFTFQSQPKLPSDRFLESFGAAPGSSASSRSRCAACSSILEEGRDRGTRPTIAGGPRKPATGFRM